MVVLLELDPKCESPLLKPMPPVLGHAELEPVLSKPATGGPTKISNERRLWFEFLQRQTLIFSITLSKFRSKEKESAKHAFTALLFSE